jgi:PHP family Zn ribbon phosphoesterase
MKTVSSMIDELGALEARIAALSLQAEKQRAKIRAKGPGEYKGLIFKATVVSYIQRRLDMKAVRRKLPPQWINRHTRKIPITSVTVEVK